MASEKFPGKLLSKTDAFFNLMLYFPFIGFIYPMLRERNSGFYLFHVRQAFFTALVFFSVDVILFFILVLSPDTLINFRMALTAGIYFMHAAYALLFFPGLYFIIKKKKTEFPLIRIMTRNFPLY